MVNNSHGLYVHLEIGKDLLNQEHTLKVIKQEWQNPILRESKNNTQFKKNFDIFLLIQEKKDIQQNFEINAKLLPSHRNKRQSGPLYLLFVTLVKNG